MKVDISVKPEILIFRKDGLPRKKPFRVNGRMGIEELKTETKDRKDRKTVPEVKVLVETLAKRYEELANTLKAIRDAPKELEGVEVVKSIEV